MKARVPIVGHLACRTRLGLAFRMALRFSGPFAGDHLASPIVVKPDFSWLETCRNRMTVAWKCFEAC